MARETLKVALPLNSAIVFPTCIFEFDANPITNCEVRVTEKADGCIAAVCELYHLADLEVGELGHGVQKSWQWTSKSLGRVFKSAHPAELSLSM